MGLRIEELTPEPIIIITGLDPVSRDDPLAVLAAVSRFKRLVSRHIYRIIDLTYLTFDFDYVIYGMVKDTGEGGIDDPNVTTIYVGTHELVQYGVDLFKKENARFGDTHSIFLFSSREEALAYARGEINELQSDG
ncbi:MAG TPA: hypothetical protein VHP83_00120 [Aggregatilineaceae bacterium]|nr:hypothetical protein [Aggregatilineaceae bacterium]